ncbi:hypothetical protein AWC38_SpisGene11609 [Stylophora pistillata]|uniref:Uncharacterized protein n=1 Tax=Stylophora pistillata TaxID=50429 RepID=A0A2B4S1Q0_STYPI|nr:hypothetical protein AWC38_SpisGene11609 [Stylophora pistillata]
MAYCEPVVEEKDPSVEDEGQQEMEKRHHSNYYCLVADIYNCGCIEGLECREAGVGNYWGRCVKVLPPTEEPGSGVGE